jgi:hypothetical protein
MLRGHYQAAVTSLHELARRSELGADVKSPYLGYDSFERPTTAN